MIKVGDRIRYVNEQTPEVTGTVLGIDNGFCRVSLDVPIFDQTVVLLHVGDCTLLEEKND